MVISGGVNIYPAEIESVLVTMPGLSDGVVFGIPDEEFGETLMALVEPMPGSVVEPEAVQAFLRRHLAAYKAARRGETGATLPREATGEIFNREKVPFIITSLQAPGDIVTAAHGYGGLVFHDVTTLRHAEKAAEHGVDGLILVSAGAGGHAGTLSPFALLAEVRRFFAGT